MYVPSTAITFKSLKSQLINLKSASPKNKNPSVKSSTCLYFHQPRGLEIDKVNRVPITALKLCQKESSVIASFIEEIQSVASAQNELD